MNPSDAVGSHEPDPVILLVAHMICSDLEIHAAEVQHFEALASAAGASPATLAAADRIFAQAANMISFDQVCRTIPVDRREEALRKLLAIAYADGVFSPPERELLHTCARAWEVQAGVLEAILADGEAMFAAPSGPHAKGVAPPTLGARLLQGVDVSGAIEAKRAITQRLN